MNILINRWINQSINQSIAMSHDSGFCSQFISSCCVRCLQSSLTDPLMNMVSCSMMVQNYMEAWVLAEGRIDSTPLLRFLYYYAKYLVRHVKFAAIPFLLVIIMYQMHEALHVYLFMSFSILIESGHFIRRNRNWTVGAPHWSPHVICLRIWLLFFLFLPF